MIQFDRIENDRMYLGFTEIELDEILTLLEKYRPDDEITNRIDRLAMGFHAKQNRKKTKE